MSRSGARYVPATVASTVTGNLTLAGTVTASNDLAHTGTKAGFFGTAAVVKPAALTAADAAAVDAVYGAEEAGVIGNLRTRVNELESRLRSLGLLT